MSTGQIRKAASLIINCATSQLKSDFNYKTLLLKRSSNMKSAPNRYVFPGGVYDHEFDASIKWLNVFSRTPINPNDFFKNLLLSQNKNIKRPDAFKESYGSNVCLPPEISFRLCAIRETFEETGLLLARKYIDQNETSIPFAQYLKHTDQVDILKKWFKIICEKPHEFLNMFLELDLVPDIYALHEWSNWMTPGIEDPRFDAVFFITCLQDLPKDTIFNINLDESQSLEFYTPDEPLEKYKKREMMFFPPQLYELTRLCNHKDINELSEYCIRRQQTKGVSRWLPKFTKINNEIVGYLPGDDHYNDDTSKPPVNKNRFYRTSIEGQKVFMYHLDSNCILNGEH